jgi:hypothetical protein
MRSPIDIKQNEKGGSYLTDAKQPVNDLLLRPNFRSWNRGAVTLGLQIDYILSNKIIIQRKNVTKRNKRKICHFKAIFTTIQPYKMPA